MPDPTADDAQRAVNRHAVESFFDPRPGSRASVCAPDMRKSMPFAARILPRWEWSGLDELAEGQPSGANVFENLIHRDVAVHECVDPRHFWVLTRFDENTRLRGVSYPQHYVHHLVVDDGLVTLWEEYFDALIFQDVIAGEPARELPGVIDLHMGPEGGAPAAAAPDDPAAVTKLRAENEEIVRAFLTADLSRPGARDELWAHNAVKELAWPPRGLPSSSVKGREQLIRMGADAGKVFQNCVHTDLRIYSTLDPAVFWATSHLPDDATLLGQPYPQRLVLGIRVDDGLVSVYQEYFDALLTSQAIEAGGER